MDNVPVQSYFGTYLHRERDRTDGAAASAEWIEEAPSVGGQQTTLAKLGHSQLHHHGHDGWGGGGFQNDIEMVSLATGEVISTPGPVTNNSFTVTYTGTPPTPPAPVLNNIAPGSGAPDGARVRTVGLDHGHQPERSFGVSFGAAGASTSIKIVSATELDATSPPGRDRVPIARLRRWRQFRTVAGWELHVRRPGTDAADSDHDSHRRGSHIGHARRHGHLYG